MVRTARALRVLAGPSALAHLRRQGLQASDVRVIPAAAGGPKGLILHPLDRFLFGDWLPRSRQTVHLLGASIGAWRLAAACLQDPQTALSRMASDYVNQSYPHAPGRAPTPDGVSRTFAAGLAAHFGGREGEVLAHPRLRLHIFTSRGRRLLAQGDRRRMPLGFGLAWLDNFLGRPRLGRWLERVVFSDPRDTLPVPLDDLSTQQLALTTSNLQPALQASCAIPFWLNPVRDIPEAPPGAYWDGGLTDYHLHLAYHRMTSGWVLYPHFQSTVVPGWLDKALAARHRATRALDRVILLAPRAEWVAGLPGGKLPDRNDFRTFADDVPERRRRWQQAVQEATRLADEFREWVEGRLDLEPEALS